MARFGFVGPSYTSRSVSADAQKCLNWYVEAVESGMGKSRAVLYPTPGTKAFSSLTGIAAVGKMLEFKGRLFAVGDRRTPTSAQLLFEILSDGTSQFRGTLGDIGTKPFLAANNANQLMISSGGRLFMLNLPDNVLSEIDTTTGTALQGPVSRVFFSDGFFIASLRGTQKFQLSAPLDGSSWDPTDIAQVEVFPDDILAITIDHREIAVMGPKQTAVYYDSGNPDFPFDLVPGGFIEQGILAPDSLTKLDNSEFWIGGDERGGAMAWRAQGYVPVRISNHALEVAWQGYATAADAVGYSYQEAGHTFWVLYFPTANKTWVYDAATGLWHERAALDGTAHRSQCHAKAFGKTLVGDWASGTIYEMSSDFLTDSGALIRRVRRAPHVADELKWMFHSQLVVDAETGLGPQPPLLDGKGFPRAPQMMMRMSDDGSHTWSNEYVADCGKAGDFKNRAVWRRLGRSRDRVYEISVTDPIPWRIIDAYIEATE